MFLLRFDSEYGGQSFGFTSDGESDFVHDDEDVNVVQAEVSATAGAVASALSAEPVKCKNLPYIVEEREVLQNIRIVKNVRNMFVK